MGLGHLGCRAARSGYLKRFGSVTVLNGHIHQIIQKVEGNGDVPHRGVDRLPAAPPGECATARPDERCRPTNCASSLGLRDVALRRRRVQPALTEALTEDPGLAGSLGNQEEIVMPKILFFAAALAAAPVVAFAGDAVTAAAVTPTVVEIHNMKFNPGVLTIAAGTKVTWVNEDEAPHTVTDEGKVFRSAGLDTKDSFSYTFASPGEFTYYCTIHPMMVGKIVVKPAGSSS